MPWTWKLEMEHQMKMVHELKMDKKREEIFAPLFQKSTTSHSTVYIE